MSPNIDMVDVDINGNRTHIITTIITIFALIYTFIIFVACYVFISAGIITSGQRPFFPETFPVDIKIIYFLQIGYLLQPLGLLVSLIVSIVLRNYSYRGKGLMILNILLSSIMFVWMCFLGIAFVFPWTLVDLIEVLSIL